MASIFQMGEAEAAVVTALHDAVRDHCRATGDTHADLAAALNMRETQFTCMLNGHERMPLWFVQRVSRLIKRPDGIQALCGTYGGYMVLAPRDGTIRALTTKDATTALKECTESATTIIYQSANIDRLTDLVKPFPAGPPVIPNTEPSASSAGQPSTQNAGDHGMKLLANIIGGALFMVGVFAFSYWFLMEATR